MLKVFDEAVAALKAAGAEIVDPANLPQNADVSRSCRRPCSTTSSRPNINKYFQSLGPTAPVKSLTELIAFNEAHRDREMPLLRPGAAGDLRGDASLDAPEYRQAVAAIQRATRAEASTR